MNSENKNKKTEEDTEMVNPFERRESLQRTPPRMRAYSLPDLETNEEGICTTADRSNKQKRKRTELSPEDEAETKAGVSLKDVLEAITKHVKTLEKEVKGSYKLKKEIVEISYKLAHQTTLLQSEEMATWLQNSTEETYGQYSKRKLQVENEELRREIKTLENKLENTKKEEVAKADMTREAERNLRQENQQLKQKLKKANKEDPVMQCENCKHYTKRMIRRNTLKKVEDFEHFQLVTEDDWNQGVFPKLKIASAPIWEAPSDSDIILPCSKEFDSTDKITKGAITRFGGKEGLAKQNKAKGEVATMIHSLGFPDESGSITHTSRAIYYPILTEGEPWEEVKDEIIYKTLSKIKESLKSNSNRKIAIPQQAGIAGVILERIAEYLFSDTNVEIQLYKPNEEKKGSAKNTPFVQGPPKVNLGSIRPTSQKKKEQEAVLVKMRGTPYAELLKKLKETVNPEEIGVDLSGVKQTRNGDMILIVKNGANKAEDLKNMIKEKLPTANTSHLISKKVIHIKDLDGITNTEEVRDAISRLLATDEENIEIRALRPSYGGRQNVTAIVKSEDADKLIQMRHMKIGWTNCRIIERKQETKCHRCWTTGHLKTECTGPDRTMLCLKCAKPGHKAADCKNTAYCVHCNQEGHQSSSQKCTRPNTVTTKYPHENSPN